MTTESWQHKELICCIGTRTDILETPRLNYPDWKLMVSRFAGCLYCEQSDCSEKRKSCNARSWHKCRHVVYYCRPVFNTVTSKDGVFWFSIVIGPSSPAVSINVATTCDFTQACQLKHTLPSFAPVLHNSGSHIILLCFLVVANSAYLFSLYSLPSLFLYLLIYFLRSFFLFHPSSLSLLVFFLFPYFFLSVCSKELEQLSQYSVWLQTGQPGFDPRQRQTVFPLASVSRPALGPTQAPVQRVPGVMRGRGVTLTTHPLLEPRSRTSRSYNPLLVARMTVAGQIYYYYFICLSLNVAQSA
jgi:hypothetical protein